MNTHTKLVAILHIVWGAVGLMGAGVILAIFGTASGIALWQSEPAAASVIGIVAICIIGLIALLSLPEIIGGWGLLAGKSWGTVVVLALGILNLLNFPIGTALGVYTLWALLREQPVGMARCALMDGNQGSS